LHSGSNTIFAAKKKFQDAWPRARYFEVVPPQERDEVVSAPSRCSFACARKHLSVVELYLGISHTMDALPGQPVNQRRDGRSHLAVKTLLSRFAGS
jgi:hypothetical protein